MERFEKIVTGLQPLSFFAQSAILHVWLVLILPLEMLDNRTNLYIILLLIYVPTTLIFDHHYNKLISSGSLEVSDLRSETKGSQFQSGC